MWISSHLLKFAIYFVVSGGQLSWVFDPRLLSYLEHCCCDVRNLQINKVKKKSKSQKNNVLQTLCKRKI